VASNPRIIKVYDLYLDAFEKLRRIEPLLTLEDNDRFCRLLQVMLDVHRVVIPELAIGIAESSPDHLTPNALDTFMTRMRKLYQLNRIQMN
jgi:pyruvate dehydrogenase kinase 2/3/4